MSWEGSAEIVMGTRINTDKGDKHEHVWAPYKLKHRKVFMECLVTGCGKRKKEKRDGH